MVQVGSGGKVIFEMMSGPMAKPGWCEPGDVPGTGHLLARVILYSCICCIVSLTGQLSQTGECLLLPALDCSSNVNVKYYSMRFWWVIPPTNRNELVAPCLNMLHIRQAAKATLARCCYFIEAILIKCVGSSPTCTRGYADKPTAVTVRSRIRVAKADRRLHSRCWVGATFRDTHP